MVTQLGEPIPVLNSPVCKEVFPDTQPKHPLAQLEAISPRPVTWHQWEETNPALTAITFQVLEEGNKVSPQPPLPQTKQPQFLQLLLIGHVLQALHKTCCPSLDLPQHLSVLSVMVTTYKTPCHQHKRLAFQNKHLETQFHLPKKCQTGENSKIWWGLFKRMDSIVWELQTYSF